MTGFVAKSLAATVSVIQRIMPINQMIHWGWKAPSTIPVQEIWRSDPVLAMGFTRRHPFSAQGRDCGPDLACLETC